MRLDRITIIWMDIILFSSPWINIYFYSKLTRNHKAKKLILYTSILFQILFTLLLLLETFTIHFPRYIYDVLAIWIEIIVLVSPLINIYWLAIRAKMIWGKFLTAVAGLILYALLLWCLYHTFVIMS